MKYIAYIAGGLVGAFVIAMVLGMIFGPKSYADLGQMYAQDCVRNKGYGNWRGSMGTSLEDFCSMVGNAKALLEHRRDHPENY